MTRKSIWEHFDPETQVWLDQLIETLGGKVKLSVRGQRAVNVRKSNRPLRFFTKWTEFNNTLQTPLALRTPSTTIVTWAPSGNWESDAMFQPTIRVGAVYATPVLMYAQD